jgi:hypothetical protein
MIRRPAITLLLPNRNNDRVLDLGNDAVAQLERVVPRVALDLGLQLGCVGGHQRRS